MRFIIWAGDDLPALGQGTNDVPLGSGYAMIFCNGGTTAVSSIMDGSGSLDLAFSGASTVLTIAASGTARAFNLYAYAQGQDAIHLQGYGATEAANALTTQRSVGGDTQLSLSDGTVLNLADVGHATTALFS